MPGEAVQVDGNATLTVWKFVPRAVGSEGKGLKQRVS